MIVRISRCILLLLCVLVLIHPPGFAQQGTTSLRGSVTDPQASAIPGASVVLEDTSRGLHLETSTNQAGFYEFLQLSPGTYHLTISAPGFKILSQENLVLRTSTPVTFNTSMTVSAVAETVTVSSSAVSVLNSTDATLGNAFDSRQVLELPSEGRNPVELLSLQAGVTYTGNQVDPASDSRGGSVNGARSDQTNLTVDGIDNNDQLLGTAFTGVIRIPSESIAEFRVTTSSANADTGRSSGGQVAITTKTGTNSFHGAAYEYNRSSIGEANDWFNKRAQLANGEPNKPGKLIRNTFGGALGGPIWKDRLFFFANYEGQRSSESVQITQPVPSDPLRQGIIQYYCDVTDPNCSLNNSTVQVSNPGGNPNATQYVAALSPANLAALDTGCANPTPPLVVTCPLGPGVNPAILNLWNGGATLPNGKAIPAYPHSNTSVATGSDGLNVLGFTFAAPEPQDLNTYLARIDYNITANGNHRLFVRGGLLDDHISYPPEFPGQPPASLSQNNSKGLFVGYTGILSTNVVENFRYGFIRQSVNQDGQNPYSYVSMWNLADQVSFARTTKVNVPVNQFVDDVTWIRGKHTLQFGGNWRIIHNNRLSDAQNYFSASPHPTFFAPNGTIANSGQDLDPSILASAGYPLVSNSFGGAYDGAVSELAGVLGSISAVYQQDKNGPVATGTLIPRHFKANELEFYAQDAWRATANFTVTYGLRYTLLQPPYETHGNQVTPDPGLGDFFQQRAIAMEQGQTYSPPISFALGGKANGGQPYWNWDYKDFAPRFAFAWSPSVSSGLLGALFGSAGKTSIRGGYGMYYDHFGEGVVNTFDRQGSLGLTTYLENPSYVTTTNCAARFVSITTIPDTLACPLTPGGNPVPELPSAPAYGFPFTPPGQGENGSFAIGWGIDNHMKTPYAHAFDFSVARELPKGFSIETSYVGRLGHRLLQEVDLAQPLNITDPQSGMTYYQAAAMLAKDAAAGIPENQIQPIPYWQNLFASAAGPGGITGAATGIPANPTATQNIYDLYVYEGVNGISALQSLDTYCFPACAQLPGQSAPTPYNYFDPQFSSLYSWRSIGHSYYNGLLVTLRRHISSFQFDLNYTYSKSIDMNSNAERINEYENGAGTALAYNSQTVNAWSPFQLRGPSDYDLRHQINFNWLYQFPFGRGQRFGSDAGKVGQTIIGGWELTGLVRWTSGYPFSISTYAFPTNYEQDSKSFLIGHVDTGTYTDVNGQPNAFKQSEISTDYLAAQFRYAYPGESGQRNNLRGPGYFGIDASLGKTFNITERQTLRFQWDTYNVTNAVRFDVGTISNYLFYSSTLGEFTQTLTKPRVMQFGLRYSF
jgi:hypothetical protein